MKPPFNKILIANRGEIAVRIIRACHELGIKTVAVHSIPDVEALHVKIASESICIGPASVKDSYLNIANIMAAACSTGADAIHPGYGFLSENPGFAEICQSCGITFIGPTVRNMRLLGDKARARKIAEKAGIPTVPGESKGFLSSADALAVAKKAGFPVILKSCAGGGGRGMKIVETPDEFVPTFERSRKEVEAAFGDGHLLVEKYLRRIRHIEVQVAGDLSGNIIHLGVRDCSIQRRYQKLIEECPPIGVLDKVLGEIQDAALVLARSVGYMSVGTVEFILDIDTMKYFFIEMNTRLQVEHPVTEMATDTDIVKEQIRVGAGLELSVPQKNVMVTGHTIEARINAENPKTMLPSPGLVTSYHPPGGHGVRVDSAVYSGYTVQPFYDSLIAKLIVRANDRAGCIQKLLVALDEFMIEGVETNIELHKRILTCPSFKEGQFDTNFLNTSVFSLKDEI